MKMTSTDMGGQHRSGNRDDGHEFNFARINLRCQIGT